MALMDARATFLTIELEVSEVSFIESHSFDILPRFDVCDELHSVNVAIRKKQQMKRESRFIEGDGTISCPQVTI